MQIDNDYVYNPDPQLSLWPTLPRVDNLFQQLSDIIIPLSVAPSSGAYYRQVPTKSSKCTKCDCIVITANSSSYYRQTSRGNIKITYLDRYECHYCGHRFIRYSRS